MDIERWKSITRAEKENFARAKARELPTGFSFRGISRYRLGNQENDVAEFAFKTCTFVFIPGGDASLGYDLNRGWKPTSEEIKSWEDTSSEYGIDRTIEQYVADTTFRPRRATIKPILLEAAAINEFTPTARSYRLSEIEKPYTVFLQSVSKDGLRFPTSDEWEYACGGGAQTLFRWGDHAIYDRYPTDEPNEENELKEWNLHLQPNAFGIFGSYDPYKCELLAEAGSTRGGDGGAMICGGAGFFVGWLTLATAYYEKHACKYDPKKPLNPEYIAYRRVLEL